MATDRELAVACARVMRKRGYSIDRIQKRAPRGFWELVAEVSGDSRDRNALSNYWKRHMVELTALIQAELGAEQPGKVDIVDSVQVAKVDNILAGEPETQDASQKQGSPVNDVKVDRKDKPDVVTVVKVDRVQRQDHEIQDRSAEQEIGKVDIIDNEEKKSMAGKVDTLLERIEERIMAKLGERMESIENTVQELVVNVAKVDIQPTVNVDNVVIVDMKEDPPLPGKAGPAGKRLLGSKGDVRARVDSRLADLLNSECEVRYGGNMSRCLDAILWRYFGKPDLSFQTQQIPSDNADK